MVPMPPCLGPVRCTHLGQDGHGNREWRGLPPHLDVLLHLSGCSAGHACAQWAYSLADHRLLLRTQVLGGESHRGRERCPVRRVGEKSQGNRAPHRAQQGGNCLRSDTQRGVVYEPSACGRRHRSMWANRVRGIHRRIHQPRRVLRAAVRLRGPGPVPELHVARGLCLSAGPAVLFCIPRAASPPGAQRRERALLRCRRLLRHPGVFFPRSCGGLCADRHGPGHAAVPLPVSGLHRHNAACSGAGCTCARCLLDSTLGASRK
mmetsp:Transcript_97841/g.169446  ORF Transcript_97841/g.169446 Transcript_97841/m.169446 type:complete len:262 (-) Transcript_97841:588-1373(-)